MNHLGLDIELLSNTPAVHADDIRNRMITRQFVITPDGEPRPIQRVKQRNSSKNGTVVDERSISYQLAHDHDVIVRYQHQRDRPVGNRFICVFIHGGIVSMPDDLIESSNPIGKMSTAHRELLELYLSPDWTNTLPPSGLGWDGHSTIDDLARYKRIAKMFRWQKRPEWFEHINACSRHTMESRMLLDWDYAHPIENLTNELHRLNNGEFLGDGHSDGHYEFFIVRNSNATILNGGATLLKNPDFVAQMMSADKVAIVYVPNKPTSSTWWTCFRNH